MSFHPLQGEELKHMVHSQPSRMGVMMSTAMGGMLSFEAACEALAKSGV